METTEAFLAELRAHGTVAHLAAPADPTSTPPAGS